MNKNKKLIFNFVPGNLGQWIKFESNNFTVWIASINKKDKFKKIEGYLKYKLDRIVINKIIKILGNQFGIIIYNYSWIFAATDCCRSYPIFWRLNKKKITLSPQANLIQEEYDEINYDQLQAYRMSGYTIDDSTLWKKISNLKSGSYLFFTKKNLKLVLKQYFLYEPWNFKNKKISIYENLLKKEINKLLLNIIKDAKGRMIIIPLSAGLDSRLIVSGLRKHNYKRVKCYSYGQKNNFEGLAAKKIAKKLNYDWKFVEINYATARNFYNSNEFKKYLSYTNDGISVPTIHSLYAVSYLLKNKFIKKNDIIINGNSGDFISGGHIPNAQIHSKKDTHKLSSLFNSVFEAHFLKHYSLWQYLVNEKNKKIIKNTLYKQLKSSIKNKKNITAHGILELLEYENRQAKYVVNCQRLYDYNKIDWLLPLWNISFVKFWKSVPIEYKLNQMLYKKVLYELNLGNVWTKEYNILPYITPKWVKVSRLLMKIIFFLFGKKKWHAFERRYILYWTDIVYGLCIHSYMNIIKNKNGFRHAVSWLALITEKLSLGKSRK